MFLRRAYLAASVALTLGLGMTACGGIEQDRLYVVGWLLGADGYPIPNTAIDAYSIFFRIGSLEVERTYDAFTLPAVTGSNSACSFEFRVNNVALSYQFDETELDCYNVCVAYDLDGVCIETVLDCYPRDISYTAEFSFFDVESARAEVLMHDADGALYRILGHQEYSGQAQDCSGEGGCSLENGWNQRDIFPTPFVLASAAEGASSAPVLADTSASVRAPLRRLTMEQQSLLTEEQMQILRELRTRLGVPAEQVRGRQ